MRSLARRAAVGAALVPTTLLLAPAGGHACSIGLQSVQTIAPADNGTLVQTGEALPIQIRADLRGANVSQAHSAWRGSPAPPAS